MTLWCLARRAYGFVTLALVGLFIAGCMSGGQGGGSGGGGSVEDDSAGGDPDGDNGGGDAGGDNGGRDALTADQKRRAEQITSVFENDTIELQYAYVEALDDGRGYTVGRAGFTSGTGDLLLVVERFTEDMPDNELAEFLPRLVELAEQESGSIEGLDGLPEAWERAAADPAFRAVQDEIVDELYYQPAVVRWEGLGLTTALSLAALYDAIIQHGEGDDPDGLPAMIDRATDQAGGSPASGVDEATWLTAFLEVRTATLEFAFDPDTREAWALGADRPEVFQQLLDEGNVDLDGPIFIDTSEHTATVP